MRPQVSAVWKRQRQNVAQLREYGRYLGMSEGEVARALFKLTAEDRQQADAEQQRLRHEMGYREQD